MTTLFPIRVFLSKIALLTVEPSPTPRGIPPPFLNCNLSSEERIELRKGGGIPLGVGEGSTVKRAILDKNTRIGNNVVIVNKDRVEEADRPDEGFYIRNGIVVVVKNATITDGTII